VSAAGKISAPIVPIALLLLIVSTWTSPGHAAQLQLSWVDNSTNEDGFSIERSLGTTGPFAQIATTAANTASYTDTSLADGTTYCYQVRAFNTVGYSGYTTAACATTAQSSSPTLTITKAGGGKGTVNSSPTGLSCGATCSASFPAGTAVSLTAVSATGSLFAGWSGGGCSGTGPCTVTLTAATAVTATFRKPKHRLTTTTVGTGAGTVTSTAGTGVGTVTSANTGTSCGSTCSAEYESGTVVTLAAFPAVGSLFAGWDGGGCSGAGSCRVILTAPTTITAIFQKLSPLGSEAWGPAAVPLPSGLPPTGSQAWGPAPPSPPAGLPPTGAASWGP
jgi:Divergent InlB B-repeat domain